MVASRRIKSPPGSDIAGDVSTLGKQFYLAFGEMVRQLCASRGLGLAELARMTGMNVSVLSRMLLARRQARFDDAIRICVALGLSVPDLVNQVCEQQFYPGWPGPPKGHRATGRGPRG
jgi:DNA-binding phage protein